MNLKAAHTVSEDGEHEVSIEGLRVWVHRSGAQWIAQGLDIDYVVSGESQELATRTFAVGFCCTVVEHVRRFHSLDKLLARRAPDSVFRAWHRELEKQNLAEQRVPFRVPESEFDDEARLRPIVPPALKFFVPSHP